MKEFVKGTLVNEDITVFICTAAIVAVIIKEIDEIIVKTPSDIFTLSYLEDFLDAES